MPEVNTERFSAPVPAAVKAAKLQAEALQKELINPTPPEGPKPGEEQEEVVAEGQEPPQTPPQEPPQPLDEPDENHDSWKHKFQSMQGRYQSEIPKLRDQVKQMSGEIGNLNRLLASVQQPTPPKPPEPPKQLITPEEIAEYGPETVDLMTRVAKQASADQDKEIATLKAQINQLGGQIATTARGRMLEALAEAVPNWQAVNADQAFLDWLALPDAYSGDIRHNMLGSAFDRNDTRRVINFFKGFLAESAATAPADEEEPGQGERIPKTPLRDLAAPGRAKSTAAPPKPPAEKPIFTTSQITAFYTDKANGKYRGREKVAAETEAAIFMAQAEGRIR